MSESIVDIKRRHSLPEWRVTAGGRKKHLNGRWSKERIAEELARTMNKKHTLDDLARLVYGSTGKINRDNVRKHIPGQRAYNMARMAPFITYYGPRGTIEAIKQFDQSVSADVDSLNGELSRLIDRGEMTEERCEQLRSILFLPPTIASSSEAS